MRQGCRIIQTENFNAIICRGEPQDHECNENDIIYFFSDGFRGTVFEKAKEEKMNLSMCNDDILYFLEQRGIDIRGGSVACSICGRAAIDNMYYLP